MEWSKAKDVIAVLLVALNIFLAVFIKINNDKKYVLSSKQKRTIVSVLDDNNVEYKGEFVKSYEPKKKIKLNKYEFDNNNLLNIFFEEQDNVKISTRESEFTYKDDTGTLFIRDDFVFYESEIIDNKNAELSKEETIALCKDIIEKLGKDFKSFKLDKIYYDDENNMVVYFRDNFEGYIINSNYIKFVISANRIISVVCEYAKPDFFVKESRRIICSPNDALITFINNYKANSEGQNEKIAIDSMEVVYNIDDISFNAVPCYRINVNNTEHLVNAYFNRIIEN